MKSLYRNFTILTFALAVTACAQLGLATPQSFSEKVAVAYGTVTQVRTSATQLLEAKKITADDAQNVQNSADVARTGIDTARKIHATDATGADAKLNAIRVGLDAIATYLATRGK